MAHLTPAQFSDKWIPLLANNVFQLIDGTRLGQFITDITDSFADAAALRAPTVPDYDAAEVYAVGNLVLAGLPKRFYRAKVPGLLPAPTPGQETTEWLPVDEPLSPLLPYRELPVGQAQQLGSSGKLEPGTLYRLTGRQAASGQALDDVLALAVTRHQLASDAAYEVGLDAQQQEYLLPVSYELATDATSARAAVDAYTKAVSDARYVQATEQAAGYAYAPAEARDAVTTIDIAGRYVAHLELSLRANTTLEFLNVPNGYQGAIKVTNVMTGPVSCALPKGSFGPKNYYPTLAAGEIRMLGIMKAGSTLCINSQPYFEVK